MLGIKNNGPLYGWIIVAIFDTCPCNKQRAFDRRFAAILQAIKRRICRIGAIDAAMAESFIANGANITFLMSGVFSLLGGWLVTRFRLRPLMIVGCGLLGLGLVIHSQAVSKRGLPRVF